MIKSMFFRNGARNAPSKLSDEALAQEARRKYKEFLSSCMELKSRGYGVQLCFSHLDRSKDFRPEELIRIDVEISGTKHL